MRRSRPSQGWVLLRLFSLFALIMLVSSLLDSTVESASSPAIKPNSVQPASTTFPETRSKTVTASTGLGTWDWQNPAPQGNPLNGIACPSVDICFAVGYSGTIVATVDGGLNWVVQTSGTGSDLFGISCASPTICYASGSNGVILKTTDGGTTWATQTSGTALTLNGIACPNATTCYAVGASTTIVATTNGSTWNIQTSGTGPSLNAISCPSVTVCFAVGGTSSTNGSSLIIGTSNGTNWGISYSGNQGVINGVSCFSTTICYASGDYLSLKTINGGGWSVKQWAGYSLSSGTGYAVGCLSATGCVTVSTHFTGSNSMFSLTTDGGTTWYYRNSGMPNVFNGIACPDSVTCYAVGGATPDWGGTIIKTTNGGYNWAALVPNYVYYYYGVACPGPSTCFAVGGNGKIVSTTNLGNTWKSLSSGTTENLYGISCLNLASCYAVGSKGKILATSDNGVTWTSQTSGTSNDLNDISCHGSNCYAVGSAGTVVALINGSWTVQTSGASNILWNVDCPTDSTCFATGEGGTVLNTTNSGSNWTSQNSTVNANISGISCPDLSNCFALTDYIDPTSPKTTLITHDGGNTWASSIGVSGLNSFFHDISCPTVTTCFAFSFGIGDRTNISITTDGGNNWTNKVIGSAFISPYDITCNSVTTCVMVGGNGTIFNTTNGGTNWNFRPFGIYSDIVGMSCPSSTTCFAVGIPSFSLLAAPDYNRNFNEPLVTTNGGNTWLPLSTGLAGQFVNISCPSTTTCFAVGSDYHNSSSHSLLAATVDGGQTWAVKDYGTTRVLTSVSCPDINTCYAVGTEGTILARTNGGNTWTPQTSGTPNQFRSISCAATNTCVAVGSADSDPSKPTIVYTANGGNLWQASSVKLTFTSVDCPDTTTCFATWWNASTVSKTIDGGATWNTVYSSSPNTLNGVACTSSSTCFVLIDPNSFSNSDTVLYTTDGGTTWATQNTGTTNRLYNINCESGCRIMGTGGSILSNALIVTNPADNGTITAAGTLSFALNRAQAGQSITFAVSGNSITLSKPLPPLRTGANLLASCAAPITINTNHLADAGLVLSGRSLVQGIILTNVDGTGIRTTGSSNQLRCTKVQR